MGQDGIMEGTSTDRFNFRLNADSKFIDIITLGLNVSGNHEEVEAVSYTHLLLPDIFQNSLPVV